LNNNKLHKSSAIFLATVLVAGIIALSSPSFMVGAQAVPQYGMEREYGSYEQPEYGSYEQPEYGSYEQPEYGSYEQPEYPSYKPDYKPEYPSYDKDNRDKSKKDSSKSVDINKIKCINTNININGNNTGDINLGNKGQLAAADADRGYSGAYSSDGSGEGYYDGNYKKDKGITCIINNNNNNNNTVIGVDEEEPIPIPPPLDPETCEDCFGELDVVIQVALNAFLNNTGAIPLPLDPPLTIPADVDNIVELCAFLNSQVPRVGLDEVEIDAIVALLLQFLPAFVPGGGMLPADAAAQLEAVAECLIDIGVIIEIDTTGLTASNTNTDISTFDINTRNQMSSFSPPTIAQGTEGDLSALEKITKLKQQWLELLP
jgi:hypothetical protein